MSINTCVCYECRTVLYVQDAVEHNDGWYTCQGICDEDYRLRRMREMEGDLQYIVEPSEMS